MTKPVRKVLFTSHTANFSKFNRPFMRMLKAQGYEVHYASAGEEEVLDCDVHHTISFRRSPFSFSNLKAIRQLKKVIDAENYEIIHTHTPMGSVVTRLAAIGARKKGTGVIYTAHGFHFYKGAPVLNWLIYYPIEKIMARHTDTLITINKEDYERAKAHFKTDVQYVAGVGVDSSRFDEEMTIDQVFELKKSLGIDKRDFIIIYVAELSRRKNQMWLLNTLSGFLKKHQDVKLILPGIDSLGG
ncbi:MAG: glycosyltransferase [Candidatus Microsaccharimonas sp.]